MKAAAILMCVVLCGVWGKNGLKFPSHFKFGAASSAYQVEGGWNADDKSPNIWDVYVHTYPKAIDDGANGDVACDSYHRWQDDINIASDLGLDFYRFSISWSRILPRGTPEYVSKAGYKYYNNLINGLLEKGIEPVVTMYHFDLPQRFQDLGGWANPLVTDWLADYARVLFHLYGDRVKTWITINEPFIMCNVAYTLDIGPGVIDYDIGYFLCIKNTMVAHGKVAKVYKDEFKDTYNGRIGIVNQQFNFLPATKGDEDLVELADEIYSGLFSYPIYSKTGGWPPAIEKIIAENSIKKGYRRSKLPDFTEEEKELVRGSADFFGLNYYTSRLVKKAKESNVTRDPFNFITELDVDLDVDPSWKKSSTFWFYVYPEGLRNQLSWVKKHFGDIEIVIYENGYSSSENNLHDQDRIQYYKDHMEQVLLAIHEDKVNVTGYTAWSMTDNFEWMSGFSCKFGLYEVDFNSPERTRTPRDSARYYTNVIRTKSKELSNNENYINNEL